MRRAPLREPEPDEFLDNPEWTAEDFARAVPLKEGDPELYAAMQAHQQRRAAREARASKVALSVRLDRQAVARFRATGKGWQTRLSDAVTRASRRVRTVKESR